MTPYLKNVLESIIEQSKVDTEGTASFTSTPSEWTKKAVKVSEEKK